MKKSIFLYLFILALLFNVFTYVFLSKQVKFNQDQLTKVTKRSSEKIKKLEEGSAESNYFSLEFNQNAQNYFEKPDGSFIAPEKLIPFVKEQLISYNDKPTGNPYTGYEPIDGKKFLINKVKVLNHRWIIVDFNNTDLWGEAIIKYFINDDGTVDFETAESLLYSK